MKCKNKIPTYNWVELIWQRRVSLPIFNLYGMVETPETYALSAYHDLIKDTGFIKVRYYYKFIYKKYPYRLNNYDNPWNSNLDYFNLLSKGVKIIKMISYIIWIKKIII